MAKKRSELKLWIRFTPMPDITAYELACIVNSVDHYEKGGLYTDNKILITRDGWDRIPGEIQRHFALLEYH